MKKILKAAVFGAVFLLYFMGVRANVSLQEESRTVTLFLENEAADAKTAQEICLQEEEGAGIQGGTGEGTPLCFWGEQGGLTLTCQETGSRYTVTEVLTSGSPRLVLPEGEVLSLWEDGCLLDEQTAYELFGTENAAGQTVWSQEQSYTVRGTFQSFRPLMVRQAKETDGEILRAVSMKLSDMDRAAAETEQFSLKYGLAGEWVDFVFWGALAGDLLLLLPALLCAAGVRLLIREGKRMESAWGRAAFYLGAVLLAAGAFFVLSDYFSLPASMIPGEWSDFSFWEDFWEGQRKNILTIFQTAQGEAQLTMLSHFGISVLGSLSSALGCMIALRS
ncbi:MAG TPA: ABC transporter permease [Candidatus Choladousia intestinigallinarum]|nr:ABC transporter permease [Candidatus Choladousia intestinigallinarum]